MQALSRLQREPCAERELTASSLEVISEERDISDSRNGEIKRSTRCPVHGSLLYCTPCTHVGFARSREIPQRGDENERTDETDRGALSLEKMRRGWETMRDIYRGAKRREARRYKNEQIQAAELDDA